MSPAEGFRLFRHVLLSNVTGNAVAWAALGPESACGIFGAAICTSMGIGAAFFAMWAAWWRHG